MHKIAVLGDKDSIYGFSALGLSVFPTNDAESAAKLLKKLAASEYAVIYITEALAELITDEIEKYSESPLPAIILIPGVSGNTGKGIMSVKKSVEQAVGSDIIFNT